MAEKGETDINIKENKLIFSILIIGEFSILYFGLWTILQGYRIGLICCLTSWLIALPIIIITFILIKKKNIYDSYFFKLYISLFIIGLIIIAGGFVYSVYYDVEYKFNIEIIPDNTSNYEIILPLPLNCDNKSIFLDFENKNIKYNVVSTNYGRGINFKNNRKIMLKYNGLKGQSNFDELSTFNHSDYEYSYYWIYTNFSDENNSLEIKFIYEEISKTGKNTVKIDVKVIRNGWQLIKGDRNFIIE